MLRAGQAIYHAQQIIQFIAVLSVTSIQAFSGMILYNKKQPP